LVETVIKRHKKGFSVRNQEFYSLQTSFGLSTKSLYSKKVAFVKTFVSILESIYTNVMAV